MATPYRITIKSPELRHDLELINGANFKLGDLDLDRIFQVSLPKDERDLLRILFAIYLADRLVRRPRRRGPIGSREIELGVDVAHPDFWSAAETLSMLHDVVSRVSNDFWSFSFRPAPAVTQQLSLLNDPCVVCLYSGGLDSASGLVHRILSDRTPVLTVTAAHQSFRRRLRYQVGEISGRFGVSIRPIICRTRMAHPPKFSQQEKSQRLRGVLFLGLGGAIASTVNANAVEVFENGIGAINVPPQVGMMLGAMATRGCNPGFLMAMGRLISHVAGRRIEYKLPMLRATKAEAVRLLAEAGLQEVATKTVSCAHWPLRNEGSQQQCGICFSCLGRRQAMMSAGIDDRLGSYQIDLFGQHSKALYEGRKLFPLKACLLQVVALRHYCETGTPPTGFYQHIEDSEVASFGMNMTEVVDLHKRYAVEWEQIIAAAQKKNLEWANWVKPVSLAA